MPADPQAIAALKESIEHWRRLTTGERRTGERTGTSDCALCLLYNNENTPSDQVCVGCPIFEKTDHEFCYCTPYQAVQAYIEDPYSGEHRRSAYDTVEFKRLASIQLRFLQDLLQELEKPTT